jgi:hypothetical protein
MLVSLTDPHHPLAVLMLGLIVANRDRAARSAAAERSAEVDTGRRVTRGWSGFARPAAPGARRIIRVFRASTPAI